jgi:hypothetical protein
MVDREKRKRDEQIGDFIPKKLPEYLRTGTKRSRKNKPIARMTPAQKADAAESMRIFREEDR